MTHSIQHHQGQRALLVLLLSSLSLFAHTSYSAEACCDSSASCQQLALVLNQNCQAKQSQDSACESFKIISTRKLRLHNLDLSPLRSSQKDVAGTYVLNLATMTLLNEWKAGDAEGITSDGNAKLSVKQICVADNAINLKGKYGWFGFNFSFNTKLQSRQTKDQTLYGLEGSTGKERFLFIIN